MENPFKRHQSVIFALSIFLLLSGWLASGYLGSGEQTTAETATPGRSMIQKVRVRVPEVKRIIQEIVLNGRTEPARAVTLRTEVEGRVVAIAATRGSFVHKGEIIVQLDERDRDARLADAKALLEQRELEYDGIKKLQKNNLLSKIQLAQGASQLATSRALIERIKLEIRNTRVLAPFDGILDRLPVEVGSYLKIGDEVGRLLEQDPIIFVGYVSQLERHRLVMGDVGIARLVTGMVVEGELRYIASEADPITRTFRVELQIPNPDGSLVSGITAELSIPVRQVSAFQLSPALLSLNNADQLGIKIVNDQNRVEFLPVQVVKSTAGGLWISGLPKGIRIISVGQGFVRAGDEVIAVDEREIIEGTTAN
jgi:multidrug efflux system membrane fusion protein